MLRQKTVRACMNFMYEFWPVIENLHSLCGCSSVSWVVVDDVLWFVGGLGLRVADFILLFTSGVHHW